MGYYAVKYRTGDGEFYGVTDQTLGAPAVAILDSDSMKLEWLGWWKVFDLRHRCRVVPFPAGVQHCFSDEVWYHISRTHELLLYLSGNEFRVIVGDNGDVSCNGVGFVVDGVRGVVKVYLLSVSSSGDGVFRADIGLYGLLTSPVVSVWLDTCGGGLLGYGYPAGGNVLECLSSGNKWKRLLARRAKAELLGDNRVW